MNILQLMEQLRKFITLLSIIKEKDLSLLIRHYMVQELIKDYSRFLDLL